jgi:hypothetical protein
MNDEISQFTVKIFIINDHDVRKMYASSLQKFLPISVPKMFKNTF